MKMNHDYTRSKYIFVLCLTALRKKTCQGLSVDTAHENIQRLYTCSSQSSWRRAISSKHAKISRPPSDVPINVTGRQPCNTRTKQTTSTKPRSFSIQHFKIAKLYENDLHHPTRTFSWDAVHAPRRVLRQGSTTQLRQISSYSFRTPNYTL